MAVDVEGPATAFVLGLEVFIWPPRPRPQPGVDGPAIAFVFVLGVVTWPPPPRTWPRPRPRLLLEPRTRRGSTSSEL